MSCRVAQIPIIGKICCYSTTTYSSSVQEHMSCRVAQIPIIGKICCVVRSDPLNFFRRQDRLSLERNIVFSLK